MWLLPSFVMTMKMGIERRLMEKIPEIVAVESVPDDQTGLQLNAENIEKVLEEIRRYLIGAAGGTLELVEIEEPIVKVRITGPAAGVMTVRVAVTQKLREKIPATAAVQLLQQKIMIISSAIYNQSYVEEIHCFSARNLHKVHTSSTINLW